MQYIEGKFINFGEGITEAVTELMTQEICTNCGIKQKNSGYTRLVETVSCFIHLTEKEKVIQEMLKPDNEIEKILGECGIDVTSFIQHTDKIRQCELREKTFFDKDNEPVQHTKKALAEIAKAYPHAQNVDELKEKYEFYKKMSKILYFSGEYEIYTHLIEDIKRLRAQGVDVSSIAYIMKDEDIQQACKVDRKITQVLSQKRADVVNGLEETIFDNDDENANVTIAHRVFQYIMYRASEERGIPEEIFNLCFIKDYLEEHPEADYREISFKAFQKEEICIAYDLDGNMVDMFDLSSGDRLKQVGKNVFEGFEGAKITVNEDEELCIDGIATDAQCTQYEAILKQAQQEEMVQQKRLDVFTDLKAPEVIINRARQDLEKRKEKLRKMKEEIAEGKQERQSNSYEDERDER